MKRIFGLLLLGGALMYAQEGAPQQQMLAPEQLENLVAPVALYPDSLLSQVLVASTYPLEVVEAGQWLQQNRNLRGQDQLEAARQQNWDASVQALVVFPDVVTRLNQDIRWTTDLGNAFLAQQADVMEAVQRMRARAQADGRLASTPQQVVTTQAQGTQTVIEIQPANPQVVYVPVYNPAYIWGPPAYGYYPSLYYPGVGFGFGSGIYIGAIFGGGGWGGWGWGPSWYNRTVIVNNSFFHRYGFNDFHGRDFRENNVWSHDPGHRLGVPYANRDLGNRFRGNSVPEFRGGGGQSFGQTRQPAFSPGNAGRGNVVGNTQQVNPTTRYQAPAVRSVPQYQAPAERFGNRQIPERNYGNPSAFGGIQDRTRTRVQSDHGYFSMGPQRIQGGGGGFRGGGGGQAPVPRQSAPSGERRR